MNSHAPLARNLLLASVLFFVTQAHANPQWISSGVNTRIGKFHDVLLYAPPPVLPPDAVRQHLSGHGVYVLDIVNGNVEEVRVLKSAGHKILDDAAVTAMRQWRFRPHIIYKATIPIDFGISAAHSPENNVDLGEHRALVTFAPKPNYPLEARARRLGGSGVIMLDVNVETGEVTAAQMSKSTGQVILDQAALNTFRRWRFKPGKAAPHVKIPITYTVSGAAY